MTNQENLNSFIENLLKERLIFSSQRKKKDLSENGAMYFIQETKEVGEKLYYVVNKSKYYPNGLVYKDDLLKMMKKHSEENPLLENKMEMIKVGRYLGSTHCRCCKESLGNGGGVISFEYEGEKIWLNLTGGADHYLKHGINLNLISYTWDDKDKNIKLHTQFVGDVKDISVINEFVKSLSPENKIKKTNLVKP